MSFSSEIKKELCSVSGMSAEEMRAMLYGMFYCGRNTDGRQVIRTENPDLIAAAQELCSEVFPGEHYTTQRRVLNGRSIYGFSLKSAGRLINEFGDFSLISDRGVSGNDAESSGFLRGVFVSCGSVTDPKKEYHLELVPANERRAEQLSEFIQEHGIPIKTTVRGKSTVLYAKTSEVIEDFLTYIGAGLHSLEIMQVKIEKDIRNRANARVNCDCANLDKTVAASERSCRDIRILQERGFEGLSPELRETAILRLENPESSLSELCRMFDPPLSRSGLNHRLKKLSELARDYE